MTAIALYAHSLNSHVNDTLRERSGPGTAVLVTNVHYADDAAMQALLARKHAEYREGTRIHYTPHGLADTLLNLVGYDTIIVDSLNFLVSNLLLLYNSDEQAILQRATSRLTADIETILSRRHALPCKNLIFITSDVDHDLYVRSRIGKNYAHALQAANARIAPHAQDHAILLNGARWTLTREPAHPSRPE